MGPCGLRCHRNGRERWVPELRGLAATLPRPGTMEPLPWQPGAASPWASHGVWEEVS